MHKLYSRDHRHLSFIICLLSFTVALCIGCTNRNKQDLLQLNICDTSNTKYNATIKPIVTTNCNSLSGCHGAMPGSVSLENYQNVKDRIADIILRVKSGNMPKNQPKLDTCSILKIETWANKGALNN